MYHSIPLAFAISSIYFGSIIAAPAALPLNIRDVAPSPPTSIPATTTVPHAGTSTITASPQRKRAESEADINNLNDIVFPQKISSASSPTSSAASSTFVFSVRNLPRATDKPVKLAAKDLSHQARQEEAQQDSALGSLGEFSFPQKISSSSASASPTSTAFELSPSNGAVTLDP